MGNKVAILQPNYIPWKGYFDLINKVDIFVIYDTVQYTKNDWRNRNKIKTLNGIEWITIPVTQKSLNQTIDETMVVNPAWKKKHWNTLKCNYGKAKYFKEYKSYFEHLYCSIETMYLSQINYLFIKTICDILDINTKIMFSSEFNMPENRVEKLIYMCKALDADVYISGPAAKNYLDESLFNANNIRVQWMDYTSYPKYSQLSPPFEHGVTILDLIFNEGPNSKKYIKSLS